MTVNQIKRAVDKGMKVHWVNELYVVIKDRYGRYLIHCTANDSFTGLTWRDGVTLNGSEQEFYIG